MEKLREEAFLCFVTLFLFWSSTNALLSPKGINFEGKLNFCTSFHKFDQCMFGFTVSSAKSQWHCDFFCEALNVDFHRITVVHCDSANFTVNSMICISVCNISITCKFLYLLMQCKL
jgi:hypothetical protein